MSYCLEPRVLDLSSDWVLLHVGHTVIAEMGIHLFLSLVGFWGGFLMAFGNSDRMQNVHKVALSPTGFVSPV